jgi:hypothetical protein
MARALLPLLALLPALLVVPAGCRGGEVDGDPVTTVRTFLELMDRSSSDERALADAYALLDREARQALRARAGRARSLSGRTFEPWQKLAQGRYRLRFAPVSPGGLRARVQGERATVVATGARAGEHAEIPLVREGKAWRIVLALPAARNETVAEPGTARHEAP